MRTYSNFLRTVRRARIGVEVGKPIIFGTNVKIQDDNAKSKCMAPFGTGWRGQDRTASMTCNGFKKWEVLR